MPGSATDTEIKVVVKAGDAGEGDVVITADTGAKVTLVDGWTQLEEATITEVKPDKGQVGTKVIIAGERLLAGGSDLSTITLAGVAAAYEAGTGSDSEVTVVVKSGGEADKAGDVVLTADSGATVTLDNGFTYIETGAITGANPDNGQEGTALVITGTNMLGGGSKLVSVKLVGVEVNEITESNNGNVTVVVDTRASAGKGDVVLVADTGAIVTKVDGFSYLAQQTVEKITPAKGQVGTKVTVTGTALLGGGAKVESVTLAGAAAASVDEESDTKIVVTVNDSTPAKGVILITADTGAFVSSDADSWEYLENGEITSVNPARGQINSAVILRGDRLLGGGDSIASVTLAGVAATIESGNNSIIELKAGLSEKNVTGDVIITAILNSPCSF